MVDLGGVAEEKRGKLVGEIKELVRKASESPEDAGENARNKVGKKPRN
jgi:hypothetical protein